MTDFKKFSAENSKPRLEKTELLMATGQVREGPSGSSMEADFVASILQEQ